MKTVPPRRYSAEIAAGSPIRRRSQSACSSNAWKRMSRNSAAMREQDQVTELVVGRQRHVDDEQQADEHDRVERPAMAEHGVAANIDVPSTSRPRTQQVVAELRRSTSWPCDDEVDVGLDDGVGRRLEQARRATPPARAGRQPTSSGTMSAAKIAPTRYVVQRPQPTLRPDEPDERRRRAPAQDRKSVNVVAAEDRARRRRATRPGSAHMSSDEAEASASPRRRRERAQRSDRASRSSRPGPRRAGGPGTIV